MVGSIATPVTPQMSSSIDSLERKVVVRRPAHQPKKAETPKYVPRVETYPTLYAGDALLPRLEENREDDEIM